jgi:hypothetical protein
LRLEALEDRWLPSGNPAVSIGEANGNVVSNVARDAQGVRVLWGESANIDGARVATWALVSPRDNAILAAGVTFSLKLAENMPQEPGPGPAGAVASLDFPAAVQQATFFNHLEIQSNPHGHEAPPGSVNPDRNRVPHFDFHFYGVPEEQVWAIPDKGPPLPAVPADRLPAGYTQPGRSVLQMGRHSSPKWSLTDPNPLTTIMIAGYLPDGSQMHFLEPMISQEVLLSRQDFSLPVPMPQELGRAAPTLYPTTFNALFQGDAYSFAFSGFVTVPSVASAVARAATVLAPAMEQPASMVPVMTEFSPTVLLLAERLSDGPIAFLGLDVAVERFQPNPPSSVPPNPIRVAPVFALNYGDSVDGALVPDGLTVTLSRFQPTDPCRCLTVSPIFFGLADALPVDDLPT